MRNWILAVVLGMATTVVRAGESPSFSALTIPASLSKGANAVIRTEETVYTVLSPKEATQKVRQVITILNEEGKEHAQLTVPYDKLSRVGYIKGTVYDMLGKKARSLKTADIKDVSAVDDGTLFGDNRVKVAELALPTYPYTVEYEYETTSNNLLFYPVWTPLNSEKLSVEKSTFKVEMPAGQELRYRELNLPVKVVTTQSGAHTVYQWTVENLMPLELEPYSPGYQSLIPLVYTAPTVFEVEGYKGDMKSWQDLGKWMLQLNAGRDALPEATKQHIKTLTSSLKDPKDKVKAVYNYMQDKTRYVAIMLGIGGWQPFEASMVDSKGYGDCKALSNYTKALLEAAGINSYYALIKGGSNQREIMKDFPSSQFNHVVVCVPMTKDTMWLECTSQTEDAGYMGSFTGDRYALLIKPEGGVLVSTPSYKALDNKQLRTIHVKLNPQGGATGEVLTYYTGTQHEERKGILHSYKPEEQLKWLYKNTHIPAFEIKQFALEKEKTEQPQIKEKMQLELPRLASVSGRRLFITPNIMNKWTFLPPVSENRKQDVVWKSAFHDADVIEFELPAGYQPEHLPQPTKISSAFGEYKSQVQMKEGKLVYTRELTMHKGQHKPEKYAELQEFLRKVSRADQQQVVLASNPT